MKIKKMEITNISCIRNLKISFNDGLNFICGSNGIGKSSILESVAAFFYDGHGNPKLKKRQGTDNGLCNAEFSINKEVINVGYKVEVFSPRESIGNNIYELSDCVDKILFIRTSREIDYREITSISLLSKPKYNEISDRLTRGISSDEIKNWFIHSQLFSMQPKGLTEEQLSNLNFAKSIFTIIDDKFKYSHITSDTHDIIISTPSGDICFEYLSSGFKSCLYLMLGITKEIENRFVDNKIKASDFDGVILIDEPEVHLHPEWQIKISKILATSYPKAQFICATHSPHIIQELKKDQIITLEYGEDSQNIQLKKLDVNDEGFQGWTIEEILTDIMGMTDTRSERYKKLKSNFYQAINSGDVTTARFFYDSLLKIIHPNNIERKILEIDMHCLSGGSDDSAI